MLVLLPELYVYANEEITVGIFPRRNPTTTIQMYTPMMKHLEQETGFSVRLETSKNFSDFWNRVKKNRFDIVHYNQLHFVLSEKFGYEVFAKNEEFGKSLIAPALVVRKDSGINSISDLKNKRIIFGGGKLAFISNIGNKVLLSNAGLSREDYQAIFSRNPPNATLAVYFKQVDAAGIGDVGLDVPNVKEKINTDELKFLAIGPELVHLPWAYSSKLTEDSKKKIRTALLKLNRDENGNNILKNAGLTSLIKANNDDYTQVRVLYERYLNEFGSDQ